MKTLLTSLCLLISLYSSTVSAITDRADILKWCQGSSVVAAGRCIGFLLAAEDALSLGPVEGTRVCLPERIGLKELYAAILDWIPAHPEAKTKTGLGLVAQALAARYPCGE